jgi:actin-related protein 6
MGYIRSGPNAAPPPEAAAHDEEQSDEKAKTSKRKPEGEEEEQVLWMANERFAGNELLFHPSDIGMLRDDKRKEDTDSCHRHSADGSA